MLNVVNAVKHSSLFQNRIMAIKSFMVKVTGLASYLFFTVQSNIMLYNTQHWWFNTSFLHIKTKTFASNKRSSLLLKIRMDNTDISLRIFWLEFWTKFWVEFNYFNFFILRISNLCLFFLQLQRLLQNISWPHTTPWC